MIDRRRALIVRCQGAGDVQAGCVLGDVDREAQLAGLAASLGFVSTTGVAGLTLGGGFGYLTRPPLPYRAYGIADDCCHPKAKPIGFSRSAFGLEGVLLLEPSPAPFGS